ncbi:MAG: M20/M25/M40 family metallo-hydrolase [Nitrospirales bacterium]|nr:M20/M25/M40 family metallo-hydrolase [Nitrospirales bacterium]
MIPSDFINRQRLLETFIELIEINSPSFQEERIGELLVRKLIHAGCQVEMQRYDRSFNIIAKKKGSFADAMPLLVSGHMDTIEPTEGIELSVDDKIVKSTGNTVLGADDKSALSQILEALQVLHEHEIPHGEIEVVLTSAEEKGLSGAKNLDYSKISSRHGIVLDAVGEVGKVVVAAPQHITYEMRVTGKAAHAGAEPEKGISAITAAARIISVLPDGRISGNTTANVGMIRGGTATNVVPREVVIHGELRSRDLTELEETRQKIFQTAATAAQQNNVELIIREEKEYNSFRIDEKDPFLQFLAESFRKCGIEPDFVEVGSGSDANIFNAQGIKTINLSNGMSRIHTKEEQITINDLHDGCRVLVEAITDFREFRR